MKYIFFISRSCRLHRKMKMSFYEDKSAEILSKIQGVKCLILSTALKKSQKKIYKKKINGIEYLCFPNNSPETFNKKFSNLLCDFINDSSKNYLIFNQFYELDNNLYNFEKSNFLYSVHCPFSANYSNRDNFWMKIFQNFKNFPILFIKYLREIKSIKQIQNRNNSSIIYSSKFVKKFYTQNFLYYLFRETLTNKGKLIPLCIKKKSKIRKIIKLKKKLKNYKLKICFIGRVSLSKGINHILNLCKIFKENKKIIFFVGGSTDPFIKEKIITFKKKHKLNNLILHLRGIDNENVRSFYSHFDLSIHLSNVPEGTSYSIMESMISQCAPISNYSSEMIHKNHGYVIKNFSYDKIFKIINKLVIEKKIYKLKYNASQHIKQNYNEKVLIKKYKNILTI